MSRLSSAVSQNLQEHGQMRWVAMCHTHAGHAVEVGDIWHHNSAEWHQVRVKSTKGNMAQVNGSSTEAAHPPGHVSQLLEQLHVG